MNVMKIIKVSLRNVFLNNLWLWISQLLVLLVTMFFIESVLAAQMATTGGVLTLPSMAAFFDYYL